MLLGKNIFGEALYWYQKKIGSYDEQIWKKSIEERVSRGLSHAIPKKVARVKTELIDLDLIRGSYFVRAKPQQSWLVTTYLGFIRVLLFPFYLPWWKEQTNSCICFMLFTLYIMQIISVYIYVKGLSSENSKEFDDVPASEVFSPVFMFIILGTIQSQIGASHHVKHHSSHHHHNHHRHRIHSSSSTYFYDCNTSSTSSSSVLGNGETASKLAVERNPSRKPNKCKSSKETKIEHNNVDNVSNENELRRHKISDEESGLDSMDNGNLKRAKMMRKRRKQIRRVQCVPPADDNSSVSSHNEMPTNVLNHVDSDVDEVIGSCPVEDLGGNCVDTEGDRDIGDLSSADECSPYSTVNSNSGYKWESYLEMALQARSRSSTFVAQSASFNGKKGNLPDLKLPTDDETMGAHESTSSADSEVSISPASPIVKLGSDTDWGLINSDGSSDDDDDGDDVDVVDDDDDEDEEEHEEDDAEVAQISADSGESTEVPKAKVEKTERFSFSGADDRRCDDIRRSQVNINVDEQREARSNDKVSCAIWQQSECQKVDLSVLDISSAIIRKVDSVKHSNEYFYLGFFLSAILALIPSIFRLRQFAGPAILKMHNSNIPRSVFSNLSKSFGDITDDQSSTTDLTIESVSFMPNSWNAYIVILIAIVARFFLSFLFFFLLCVAERTFRERFLYSKYFCHLTSSRRARRSELPHFRLNKVRNIKSWLSVRSYLQKHGPQRSIDVIISSSFIIEVSILTFLCIQLLRETEMCSEKLYCWEMVSWNLAIGLYIMRLIILGSKMNRKSRGSFAILLSEQINLYLQLEQKPHKKDEISLANNVIKSAADLLKQLDAPFKISGFSANPYLYNITKVIVLSAFSAVLTELLGFKLKLYKIKISG